MYKHFGGGGGGGGGFNKLNQYVFIAFRNGLMKEAFHHPRKIFVGCKSPVIK